MGEEKPTNYYQPQEICSELSRLIEVGKKTAVFNRKLRVVLVGPPNAGKSSIFNKIIGLDRAIIDQEPERQETL